MTGETSCTPAYQAPGTPLDLKSNSTRQLTPTHIIAIASTTCCIPEVLTPLAFLLHARTCRRPSPTSIAETLPASDASGRSQPRQPRYIHPTPTHSPDPVKIPTRRSIS